MGLGLERGVCAVCGSYGAVAEAPPKGEIVILVDRSRETASAEDRDAMLRDALETMTVKDAAKQVAEALGLPRREVYQAALALGEDR